MMRTGAELEHEQVVLSDVRGIHIHLQETRKTSRNNSK